MVLGKARGLLSPWAGFIGGGIGWFAAHQSGSDAAFSNCTGSGPLLHLVIGLVALLVALGGGLVGWRTGRRDGAVAWQWVAMVGSLFAVLMALAIVLQTTAGLIIPRCYL